MKVILTGATGMVGQGVLRECLLDPGVTQVVTLGRTKTGQIHPKLEEIEHKNFEDFSPLEKRLTGFDACFYCMGVSSAGMGEKDYHHITYDYTLALARVLAQVNPGMTFTYVTGAGTDSTAKGRIMWARVKGATENALLALPFKAAYMFRPGLIQPLDGAVPRNKWLKGLLVLFKPLFPPLMALFPKHITTTRRIGRAMLKVTREGTFTPRLEAWNINDLGKIEGEKP